MFDASCDGATGGDDGCSAFPPASAPGGVLWCASLAHLLVQNDLSKGSKWFIHLYVT